MFVQVGSCMREGICRCQQYLGKRSTYLLLYGKTSNISADLRDPVFKYMATNCSCFYVLTVLSICQYCRKWCYKKYLQKR